MNQRVSPQAVDAERALLGGLIKSPQRIPEVSGMGLRADHFYRADHGKLYHLLLEMQARGDAIDQVTVPERVAGTGEPDVYGGIAYVMALPDQNPSTTNLPYYAKSILDRALQRMLIDAARKIVEDAHITDSVDTLLTQASRDILGLGHGISAGSWEQISLAIDAAFNEVEALGKNKGQIAGVRTGFTDLDNLLSGLNRSDLIILAARPAMGKTALALNLAQNVARIEKCAVGIFSMEMSRAQLVTRLICCEGRIDGNQVKTGNLSTDEWERFIEAGQRMRQDRIFIDDRPGLTILDVQSRAKRLKAEHDDLGLIVIDYLQLMSGDDKRAPREQQISAISRGLKGLAKDLDVPVVALSQLNRGVEQRAEKRPMVSDLRESGAIEQDADIIMFIYRDEYYNPDTADQGLAEIIVSKHRSGPTGVVKLVFEGQYTRFDNFASDADQFGL